MREGTFHETCMVTAHGSGSKWIGALIDYSTGVQSYIAAYEGKWGEIHQC